MAVASGEPDLSVAVAKGVLGSSGTTVGKGEEASVWIEEAGSDAAGPRGDTAAEGEPLGGGSGRTGVRTWGGGSIWRRIRPIPAAPAAAKALPAMTVSSTSASACPLTSREVRPSPNATRITCRNSATIMRGLPAAIAARYRRAGVALGRAAMVRTTREARSGAGEMAVAAA